MLLADRKIVSHSPKNFLQLFDGIWILSRPAQYEAHSEVKGRRVLLLLFNKDVGIGLQIFI